MSVNEEAPPTRRSRLSPEREGELYDAVLEVLREVGYEALGMPAVASRAHCSTATLYRQWQGKPGLVVAALRHHQPGPVSDVDTGTLRGDLNNLTLRMAATMADEYELFVALEHIGLHDADLAAEMREKLGAPAQTVVEQILRRAVERKDIPENGPAQKYCQGLILSMSLAHRLITGSLPSKEYSLGFVDSVLIPALRHGDD
ncbi:TetR/AcrR family transcriptional regulator [Nocardia miyunensis]|uniref:TetR/AcrR family transcriptional regulator n=1 Tax=Nocardia miyunensis TaxID=282684 RepID=UPI000836CB35|nr:TetR/AcrR family transcriptional regulator [Nocardia miyunensis]